MAIIEVPDGVMCGDCPFVLYSCDEIECRLFGAYLATDNERKPFKCDCCPRNDKEVDEL